MKKAYQLIEELCEEIDNGSSAKIPPTSNVRLFLATHLTELTTTCSILSLALVSDDGKTFYFESNDEVQRTPIVDKIISKFSITETNNSETTFLVKDTSVSLVYYLETWIANNFANNTIEIWTNDGSYDWVNFCQLFKGGMNIPKNISYNIIDYSTIKYLFELDSLPQTFNSLEDSNNLRDKIASI